MIADILGLISLERVINEYLLKNRSFSQNSGRNTSTIPILD